jgi:hypothetical protein
MIPLKRLLQPSTTGVGDLRKWVALLKQKMIATRDMDYGHWTSEETISRFGWKNLKRGHSKKTPLFSLVKAGKDKNFNTFPDNYNLCCSSNLGLLDDYHTSMAVKRLSHHF